MHHFLIIIFILRLEVYRYTLIGYKLVYQLTIYYFFVKQNLMLSAKRSKYLTN